MFKKILIANRGEIALRIVRACREMDIRSVAVFSDADAGGLHTRLADESVNIGPPLSRKSYLNIDRIVRAAVETGAEAVHPGYGFLAENPLFVQACIENNLTFIGPSPEAMAMAGDKSEARQTLQRMGIPVIPGSEGVLRTVNDAVRVAVKVRYPVIIKATGGGGGRGMRIVHDETELSQVFAVASREADAAFGNPELYLEKYIEKPRHIEIQILADHFGNTIQLGERECSIQKRYQKLIEESPSPFVDQDLRRRMGETAIRIARSIGYVNAATMEFLVDENKNYFFMEINARIQVEHPVTEMVTGIDIVQEQIRIAAGEKLALRQDDVKLNGWSIECRINAADPDDDFMPSPGEISTVRFPAGPWVRVDSYIHDRCLVPPFYDSLIGKLIVWAPDRPSAIRRMIRALSEFHVDGIKVIVPFHLKVLRNEGFLKGDINTHFLDRMDIAE